MNSINWKRIENNVSNGLSLDRIFHFFFNNSTNSDRRLCEPLNSCHLLETFDRTMIFMKNSKILTCFCIVYQAIFINVIRHFSQISKYPNVCNAPSIFCLFFEKLAKINTMYIVLAKTLKKTD